MISIVIELVLVALAVAFVAYLFHVSADFEGAELGECNQEDYEIQDRIAQRTTKK